MQEIIISEEIAAKIPTLHLGCIQCQIQTAPAPEALNQRISRDLQQIATSLGETSAISKLPEIAATRKAYKALGKDPARYRPSAEALLRRVVQGKGLYSICNAVDLLNLVSVSSGFSIGGWDASFIEGAMTLGIGAEGEPYQAVGRGELNIQCLPVFRDRKGAFGTPTSDSVRTRVRENTSDFLMVFYDFGGSNNLAQAMENSRELLEEFALAVEIQSQIVRY